MKVLFLDFDGVLHPDAVYLVQGKVVLKMDGFSLFGFADVLVDELKPYPDVKIVLSTSWVPTFKCFDKVKGHLPDELSAKIVGATYHSGFSKQEWRCMTRYQQIRRYVTRANLSEGDWIAVDNDAQGWPEDKCGNLVLTDDYGGLSDASAQADLAEKLSLLVIDRLQGRAIT